VDNWGVVERGERDQLGEGPLWSVRDNALYWVDILGKRLHRLSLSDGAIESWTMPEMLGWIIERAGGSGFIAGLRSGFAELDLDPFSIRLIGSPEPERPGNRLNDAKADSAGRIYAGSMPIGADQPSGALYRLDPDRRITRLDDGYIVSNGPAFSRNGRAMYHTDSVRRHIYSFPVRDDGSLGSRTTFLQFEADWGSPDGMTVDAEDCLWVAHWGGARISRFTPDGKLERSISLPASQISSCTFAGPNLDRMFVTSAAIEREHEPLAGALFEVDPGVKGLAPNRFGQSSNPATTVRRPHRNVSATSCSGSTSTSDSEPPINCAKRS
jgi:sugar lactone lactonase YvrE